MDTPYVAPKITTVEDMAAEYAEKQAPLMSLQVQRAYIEGALAGFALARAAIRGVDQAQPAAANDAQQ